MDVNLRRIACTVTKTGCGVGLLLSLIAAACGSDLPGGGLAGGSPAAPTTGAALPGASRSPASSDGHIFGSDGSDGGVRSGMRSATTGGMAVVIEDGDLVAGAAAFEVSSQLASDVDPRAPGTVGIVTWSVDAAVSAAHVEFGLDTTYGMRAPVDLEETSYRTLLLGMKPNRTYHFRIVAEDGTARYLSDDYVLNTGPPTTLLHLASFTPVDEAGRQRGFIVSSFWRGLGASIPFIIDADGEIVWWYQSHTNGIARARMSADGKNLWIVSASNAGGPLERVSLDTLDSQVYSDLSGSHDITPVSGETMAFLEYGESDCNSIFEVDPSGNSVEVFESSGLVGSSGGAFGGFGGCHGNAVRYSQTENVYTFSDLSEDILVLDRSGSVEWRLSERVPGGNGAWGGRQHGHQLLDESILIFANNGARNGSSALIEYTLDGVEIMRYESGQISRNLGDVQRLPGGNTLVTYSNASAIHEINGQGKVVLEINGGGASFGYALWRDRLYDAPLDLSQ